jgi:hypothetical protein
MEVDMTKLITLEYGCNICGTEITVMESGIGHLSPIYCCGVSVSELEVERAKKAVTGRGSQKAGKKTVSKKKKAKKPARKSISKKTSKKKK